MADLLSTDGESEPFCTVPRGEQSVARHITDSISVQASVAESSGYSRLQNRGASNDIYPIQA
jgi:hypothetical protein